MKTTQPPPTVHRPATGRSPAVDLRSLQKTHGRGRQAVTALHLADRPAVVAVGDPGLCAERFPNPVLEGHGVDGRPAGSPEQVVEVQVRQSRVSGNLGSEGGFPRSHGTYNGDAFRYHESLLATVSARRSSKWGVRTPAVTLNTGTVALRSSST